MHLLSLADGALWKGSDGRSDTGFWLPFKDCSNERQKDQLDKSQDNFNAYTLSKGNLSQI